VNDQRRHGPLISDVINPAGRPLALRWTGNDPTDNCVLAGLAYNRAHDWREFLEASRVHRPFDQNYVFADYRGNIGYIAAATIPMRPKGDDGRLPVEGWTGEHEWSGYVPFAELPKLYNPPQGYIVTANNKVAGDEYPYLIGTNFSAPYRAARIIEMIKRKPRLSPEDMEAMQGDVVALHARELLPTQDHADRQKRFQASPSIRTELYFGRNKPDGKEVSRKEFNEFLSGFVTERFPDGLTVLTGRGQFLNSEGEVERERSVVLILLYPVSARNEKSIKIEEIREEYKKRFLQQSVLRVDDALPVWVSF
jgi:Penicillin amidase/Protein of unknown function (DUF3574)